jgi:hypothetical protein
MLGEHIAEVYALLVSKHELETLKRAVLVEVVYQVCVGMPVKALS